MCIYVCICISIYLSIYIYIYICIQGDSKNIQPFWEYLPDIISIRLNMFTIPINTF